MLKKQFQKFVTYFIPKRIVWATGYPKGIFLKATELKGKKYISIAVTNLVTNEAIVYHVPIKMVVGIQRATTPFQRWWYAKVICKPLPKYSIKPIAK
jgi:hypothetical protein